MLLLVTVYHLPLVEKWWRFGVVYNDPKSTQKDREFADILADAIDNGVYDPSVYAEWHHLTPLCMFGSVERLENCVRLRPFDHIKVHGALAYFLPSYAPIQNAFLYTVNCSDKSPSEMLEDVLSAWVVPQT